MVFPARSALFNHNILNTKAISHFQANHILIRFVFPPLNAGKPSPCYYEKFPTAGNKRIDKIISFINSNYTRSLKLDEIAEMANMNSSAFCRFFKDAMEKTFLQYVADMRIGYACKLLTIGDMEVSQIAVECGFDSIPHFNRTFKQLTGLTPTQYRNQIMK